MPRISIIIPVYNVEKYLPRCLDSLLAQTFTDFEAICVNDGSSDNSLAILNEYATKNKRIKVITQENQGLSVARNNGVKVASGQYIYFLDSDDCLHPQAFEIAHYFITKYSADMVNFEFIKNANEGLPEIVPLKIEEMKFEINDNPLYLNEIHINVWTKLYKKSLLDGLEFIPKIHFEDYPYILAVWQKHPKTVILKENLYFYTVDENSISHSKAKPQQIRDYHTGLNFVYETYNKPEFKADFQYICQTYVPNILKQQLGRCCRSDKEIKPAMLKAFAEELRDLKAKGMLTWRGHKLIRYLKYQWIMRRY